MNMKTILKQLINKVFLPLAKSIKRNTGLETPLYKLWWDWNSENIQKKLDKQHKR